MQTTQRPRLEGLLEVLRRAVFGSHALIGNGETRLIVTTEKVARKGGAWKQLYQNSNITSTLSTFTVDSATWVSANAEPHLFAGFTNGLFSSISFAVKAPRRHESARFLQASGFVRFLLKRLLQLFAEEARLRLPAPCEFFPSFLVLGVPRAQRDLSFARMDLLDQ